MRHTVETSLIATLTAALLMLAGCKSDSTSYRERQKTAGEEVEAREEYGDTAIDDADETDEAHETE